MLRRLLVILPLLWCAAEFGVEVTDSTGRTLQIPAEISDVLPAGPPAAVLLEAIASDLVAPALPFGRVKEPSSINRLLGLSWLRGHEPVTLAATFNAVVYGRALTASQLDTVLAGVHSLKP